MSIRSEGSNVLSIAFSCSNFPISVNVQSKSHRNSSHTRLSSCRNTANTPTNPRISQPTASSLACRLHTTSKHLSKTLRALTSTSNSLLLVLNPAALNPAVSPITHPAVTKSARSTTASTTVIMAMVTRVASMSLMSMSQGAVRATRAPAAPMANTRRPSM